MAQLARFVIVHLEYHDARGMFAREMTHNRW
jgi:hypothetical protein